MDGIAVYKCPFCKCHKDISKLKSQNPSIAELGCYECQNKTCHYCYGDEDYHKHLADCHGQNHPKHKVLIDGQPHIVEDI